MSDQQPADAIQQAVRDQQWDIDRATAREQGMAIFGFPRRCDCGGRAYHSGTANWQNRVVCLTCGKKWSE